jgi:anti-sigma factor RsiW
MSCSPFDLRDYVLDELAEPERRLVEQHARGCSACRQELEQLGATRSALLALPDEEIPRRIGFVSDPVFEPSPARRWWQAFWGSSAKLGFASAAMLSAALVFSAATRPAPAPASAPQADLAALEARFNERTAQVVRQAMAESQARHDKVLAATEERHKVELHAIRLSVEEQLSRMERRVAQARLALASAE